MPGPLILNSTTAPATAAGSERTENRRPVRRYLKELLKVGKYRHPGTGQKFEVTREGLGKMDETSDVPI